MPKRQISDCDIQRTPDTLDENLGCPIELRLVELAKPVPLRLLLASPLDNPCTPSTIPFFLRHTRQATTHHSSLQLPRHLPTRPNNLDTPRAKNRPQRLQHILRPPIHRTIKRTPLLQTVTHNSQAFPPQRTHLPHPSFQPFHIRGNNILPRLIQMHHHLL